jgi:chitinase
MRAPRPAFDCKLSDGTSVACKDITNPRNVRIIQQEDGPTVLVLRDHDAFNAAIVTSGLDPEWITMGDYTFEKDLTAPHGARKYDLKFTNFPIQNTSMVVPNPKDLVTKGLGDIPQLRSDMENVLLSIMDGSWTNGSIADPAQAFSAPVFMLMQAVDHMASAKALGQQEEAAEEEAERERRENLILLIVSIVFMVSVSALPHAPSHGDSIS